VIDYSELIDGDSKLLTSLREKAPGTYKHSQNVMNMCESVAKELNLNKDLLMCAAMFHDIGKIYKPEWFTENQDDINPHNEVSPEMSYQIISRHISDSCLLLVENTFPIEVIKIVAGHHGNSVVKFFWEAAGGKDEIKDSFRYKSCPPTDTETSILMICDRLEAQARSMAPSGKLNAISDKKKLINDVVEDLIDDRQLDDLKIGNLRVVKDCLCEELKSMYHGRVDYEKAKTKDKKE